MGITARSLSFMCKVASDPALTEVVSLRIHINKDRRVPAYRQLYVQISTAIEYGEIPAGATLPKIRDLATKLGIARNTVEAAYKQLALEGYAKGRRGIGYIVEDLDFSVLEAEPPAPDSRKLIEQSETARTHDPLGSSLGCRFDFCYGNRRLDMLPIAGLKALADHALSGPASEDAARYIDSFGLHGLREQIARHLYSTRGIRCAPEQIILRPGTQVALSDLVRIFDETERVVAMEDPGYDAARYAFERAHCTIKPIPTHRGDAAFLAELGRSNARLAMVTPSNQFPLGFIMSLSTRLKLVEWAKDNEAYIIEDDYCCEYRYRSSPAPALRSIDAHRTIYLGTMSKILSPSLRISYIVLPVELLSLWNAAHAGEHCPLAWLDQEMLRAFMASDAWNRYVHATKNMYQRQHDQLVRCLRKEMGERIRIFGEDAGLHLLIEDTLGRSQEELIQLAFGNDVRVYPTDQYWASTPHPLKSLVLVGFSGIAYELIPEGVNRLAAAWYT